MGGVNHLGERGGHPRLDHAEGGHVGADAERPPLARERLRQADHAGLGRGVVRLPDVAVQAAGRAHL